MSLNDLIKKRLLVVDLADEGILSHGGEESIQAAIAYEIDMLFVKNNPNPNYRVYLIGGKEITAFINKRLRNYINIK